MKLEWSLKILKRAVSTSMSRIGVFGVSNLPLQCGHCAIGHHEQRYSSLRLVSCIKILTPSQVQINFLLGHCWLGHCALGKVTELMPTTHWQAISVWERPLAKMSSCWRYSSGGKKSSCKGDGRGKANSTRRRPCHQRRGGKSHSLCSVCKLNLQDKGTWSS